jgi:hypothetical protein
MTKAVLARVLRSLGATKEATKKALVEAIQAEGSAEDALLKEDRELLLAIDEVEQEILANVPQIYREGTIKVAATSKFTKTKLVPQG